MLGINISKNILLGDSNVVYPNMHTDMETKWDRVSPYLDGYTNRPSNDLVWLAVHKRGKIMS